MILKHKAIEIPNDDVFRNDALGRKDVIENLSTLVLNTGDPFVLSVDGKWGSGKTTFVKLWKAHLEAEHNLETIYFSAWESDYFEEPLVAILGEISIFLEKLVPENLYSEKSKKFRKLQEAGLKIIKKAAPAMLNGMTAGLLDFEKGFEKASSALSEEIGKELVSQFTKEKSIREDFEKALKEALQLLPDNKPLIVFIDELDRCRPLYAIQLLERIKHFFGVERIIFVLSIDKEQLGESIRSQYGAIDTDNYLRRFIDLQFMLPEPDIEKFCDYLYRHYDVERILSEKGIRSGVDRWDPVHFLSFIKIFSKAFELSLREIEQLFLKLDIVFKTLKPGTFEIFFRLFVLFEILSMKEPRLYRDIMKNDKDAKEQLKKKLTSRLANYSTGKPYSDIALLANIAIDVAGGISQEEYDQLREKLTKEQEKIEDTRNPEFQRLDFTLRLLEFAPDKYLEMTLDEQVKFVARKLDFLEKFHI
ncbi:KAP family P-loop NTPase fold protein [Hydrogenimonas sp.]